MADIMNILSSGYTSAALTSPSKTAYKNVDPTLFQGTWTGTYTNTKTFEISVTNVSGFRAQVKYQSGSTVKFQNVLIKDNSFRVGDTKVILTKKGSASVKTAVTDPVTGTTKLISGTATQS